MSTVPMCVPFICFHAAGTYALHGTGVGEYASTVKNPNTAVGDAEINLSGPISGYCYLSSGSSSGSGTLEIADKTYQLSQAGWFQDVGGSITISGTINGNGQSGSFVFEMHARSEPANSCLTGATNWHWEGEIEFFMN